MITSEFTTEAEENTHIPKKYPFALVGMKFRARKKTAEPRAVFPTLLL